MSTDLHGDYYRSLSVELQQLVILQRILYEGSWAEMVQDLEARRQGKPHIFTLNTRIEQDLDRIEQLRNYEKEHGIRLGDYVPQETFSDPADTH